MVLNQERFYRYHLVKSELSEYQVKVRETDLWIRSKGDLSHVARDLIISYRAQIEEFIRQHPSFLTSIVPLQFPTLVVPGIVRDMLSAGEKACTGPMAAVAGAIAARVGKGLLKYSPEVIVENGGDCFIQMNKEIEVGIYAGKSLLSNRVGIHFSSWQFPLGVCTSSGTVGHSLSFGEADAVTVVSKNVALADAAATAIGNLVKGPGDLEDAIEAAQNIHGLDGIVIIVADKLAAWGKIELVRLEPTRGSI